MVTVAILSQVLLASPLRKSVKPRLRNRRDQSDGPRPGRRGRTSGRFNALPGVGRRGGSRG